MRLAQALNSLMANDIVYFPFMLLVIAAGAYFLYGIGRPRVSRRRGRVGLGVLATVVSFIVMPLLMSWAWPALMLALVFIGPWVGIPS